MRFIHLLTKVTVPSNSNAEYESNVTYNNIIVK